MTHDTDLTCADCGGTLVEHTESAQSLGVVDAENQGILVAECHDCDARHYPDETHEQRPRFEYVHA